MTTNEKLGWITTQECLEAGVSKHQLREWLRRNSPTIKRHLGRPLKIRQTAVDIEFWKEDIESILAIPPLGIIKIAGLDQETPGFSNLRDTWLPKASVKEVFGLTPSSRAFYRALPASTKKGGKDSDGRKINTIARVIRCGSSIGGPLKSVTLYSFKDLQRISADSSREGDWISVKDAAHEFETSPDNIRRIVKDYKITVKRGVVQCSDRMKWCVLIDYRTLSQVRQSMGRRRGKGQGGNRIRVPAHLGKLPEATQDWPAISTICKKLDWTFYRVKKEIAAGKIRTRNGRLWNGDAWRKTTLCSSADVQTFLPKPDTPAIKSTARETPLLETASKNLGGRPRKWDRLRDTIERYPELKTPRNWANKYRQLNSVGIKNGTVPDADEKIVRNVLKNLRRDKTAMV